MNDKRRTVIVGIGNPNLDLVVRITDDSLLKKYGLLMNYQSQVPYEKMVAIVNDLKKRNYQFVYAPGGNVQNVLRIFQRLDTKSRYRSIMFGAVGKDENHEIVRRMVEQSGVVTNYAEVDNRKTHLIVILAYKDSRTAIACLDASSNMFTLDCLTDERKRILTKADVVVMEAFFAMNQPEVCKYVIERYDDKIIAFNLSATYVYETENANAVVDICRRSDIVIGNQREFEALVSIIGLQGVDTVDLMKQFHRIMLLSRATNAVAVDGRAMSWRKILIVTNEHRPVHFIGDNDVVASRDVIRVDDDDIVDTTGAGDSFMAGVLYGLLNRYDIVESVDIGCKVASEILKQQGAVLPDDIDFE